MCTAATYHSTDFYFGRNLDFEYGFREAVTVTPRNYVFHFRRMPPMEHHYAMIGMAALASGYPLYFDGTNEYGLSIAALNFPQSARYGKEVPGKDNVAPFELIPWVLGDCKTVEEAERKLRNANIADLSFSAEYPVTPLHWIIADPQQAITLEQTEAGLQTHPNPVGVLTNEPPFPWHMMNLNNYLHLGNEAPENRFAPALPLQPYSRGIAAMGLPGDLSSASRFVKASFTGSLDLPRAISPRRLITSFFLKILCILYLLAYMGRKKKKLHVSVQLFKIFLIFSKKGVISRR